MVQYRYVSAKASPVYSFRSSLDETEEVKMIILLFSITRFEYSD